MSRPNLTIFAPSPESITDAPLSPSTPLSPSGRRRGESTWERIQRLKRDAESFHSRRRASSATEPPITLTDLAQEVERTRIQEEEEDKQLAELEEKQQEEERKAELAKKQKEETTPEKPKEESKGLRPLSISTSPQSPEKKNGTPKTPTTPKSPRTPIKVSSAEPAEVTDDLKLLWHELRKQKTELLWVLLGFPDKKSRKVVIVGIGTSSEGIEYLKTKLDHRVVQFGALRVLGIDEHAKRPKFIGFTLVSSELTPTQKLQAIHAKEIQRDLFTGIHVNIEVTNSKDLNEQNISKKLSSLEKDVTAYDFGKDVVVRVSDLSSSRD